MDINTILFLSALALVAFLYSSVGHGGASGYLAVMAMFSIAPSEMKSSALIMNLAVSLLSFTGFYRAGHFRLKLFLPFAIASIPLSFIGGTMVLSDSIYKKILAICLFISIGRLLYDFNNDKTETKTPPMWASLASGGSIGLLSGMIGIGGGIILSPLMLLMRWATLKETAAISALFIFVNSLSGLVGQFQKGGISLTQNLHLAVIATIFGGFSGSYYGSHQFNIKTLRVLLAVGLTIACLKLLLT